MIKPPIIWSSSGEIPQIRGAAAYAGYSTWSAIATYIATTDIGMLIRKQYSICAGYARRGSSGTRSARATSA